MKRFLYNLKCMIQGWVSLVIDMFSELKYSDMFKWRRNICNSCRNMKSGICTKCGCVIAAKTRSKDSECPEGKWKSIKDSYDR